MSARKESTMSTTKSRQRTRAQGQALALFAGGLVAILAAVGLVIDGGNAYVQQRRTQTAADAAAEAGAVQLARRLLGVPGTDAQWDQRVLDLVTATAAANQLTTTDTPVYVDHDGNALGPVGTGVIPSNSQGVRVRGSLDFATYFARVIGISQMRASADATAITGYATTAGVGALIPLVFPLIQTQCESGGGSNRLYFPGDGQPWPVGPNNMVAIPLCSNGPGNVGWIDWSPPNGGASEVAAEIRNPTYGPVYSPRWYYSTETGAITSLDDDMDTWEGKDIQFPIFYAQADNPATPEDESILGTCDEEPGGNKDALADCPAGENGLTGGKGWYYLVSFGMFHLVHSYISGNHQSECNDTSTLVLTAGVGSGNLPNNCLIGYFKAPVLAGNYTAGGLTPTTEFTPVTVQLIR